MGWIILTAAVARWPEETLPPVLPLLAGTMNMVALAVRGRREAPLRSLARVVRAHRQGDVLNSVPRSLLRSAGGRVGFVAGLGMPNRFLSHYYGRGGGWPQAVASVLRYSGSALIKGPLARDLFSSLPIELSVDKEPPRTLPLSVLMAMTVDRLPLGFRLGSGSATAGMTLVFGQPDPLALVSRLPWVHRGHLPARIGLERLTCHRVTLQLPQAVPWQMDGDILPPITTLVLEASRTVALIL